MSEVGKNFEGFSESLKKVDEAITKRTSADGIAWLLMQEAQRQKTMGETYSFTEAEALIAVLVLKFEYAWKDKLRNEYPDQTFVDNMRFAVGFDNFQQGATYLADNEQERCIVKQAEQGKTKDQAIAWLLGEYVSARLRAGKRIDLGGNFS